jgi:hypothetical protein
MAQNKSHITPDNIGEWLGSTGFIFPRTIAELLRFEKLYSEAQINLEGCQIDPLKILAKFDNKIVSFSKPKAESQPSMRMAARKGNSAIPKHIMDKIIKNQVKSKGDDGGSEKENT